MAWIFLYVAGAFEIAWVIALNQSEGFSKPWPTAAFLASGGLSFWFLSLALKTLPMGTAYAVWTGIGAIGIAVIGMIWFSEPATALRIGCIGLIVAGIVGLKLAGSGTSPAL